MHISDNILICFAQTRQHFSGFCTNATDPNILLAQMRLIIVTFMHKCDRNLHYNIVVLESFKKKMCAIIMGNLIIESKLTGSLSIEKIDINETESVFN